MAQTISHCFFGNYCGVLIPDADKGRAAFTPRQPTSSVESLTNQRLHLGRDEVSDWQDAQRWLPWCGCGVIPKELELRIEDMHLRSVAQYSTVEVAKDSSNNSISIFEECTSFT
ncbi:UNVERIFIED_CONTAM: hypothetical protein NCL1_21116 [Trichonephila clavipes]